MRFTLLPVFALMGSLLLVGCQTTSVKTDYLADANFSQYSTFYYKNIPERTQIGNRPSSPNLIRDLKRTTIGALESKGYTQVEETVADFTVMVYAQQKPGVEVEADLFPYAIYPRWPYRGSQVDTYQRAYLIVDVIDNETNELVWRGWSSQRLRNNPDPQRLRMAITEMMKAFPAKGSSLPLSPTTAMLGH